MELSISYLSRFFTVIAVFISTSSANPVSDATSKILAALFSEERPLIRQTRSGPNERRLYASSGFYLEVLPSGLPVGVRADRSQSALFEVESPMIGFMSFRHIATGRYLAIDEEGNVFTSERAPLACMECCFKHVLVSNLYHVFSSVLYPFLDPSIFTTAEDRGVPQFHLAINKRGEVRTTSNPNKRMSLFLLH
ncbi:fibroblast growth factor 9-like [Glandiceps talaboti]